MAGLFSEDFFVYLSKKFNENPEDIKKAFNKFFSGQSLESDSESEDDTSVDTSKKVVNTVSKKQISISKKEEIENDDFDIDEDSTPKKDASKKTKKSNVEDTTSKKKNIISKKTKKSSEEEDTNEFVNSVKPTSKSNKSTSKATSKMTSHLCERIPRGKAEQCGKTAKKSIEENGETHWYCGTEKAGCYHSILGSTNKIEKGDKIKKSQMEKGVGGGDKNSSSSSSADSKKSQADIKSISLIHKITKRVEVPTKSIMVNDKKYHINLETRVLFYRDGVAFGVLDKDNKTILPLDDKNIRWLEASNMPIEQKNKKESDDEENSEAEDEEENSEADDDEDIDLDESDEEEFEVDD